VGRQLCSDRPAELRAFTAGISSTAELDDDLIGDLAHGLVLALDAFAEMGFQSFNCAIYGAPPATERYPLNLRLACRSNLKPFYRSDSAFRAPFLSVASLGWSLFVACRPLLTRGRVPLRLAAWLARSGRGRAVP
jgi:hypothetical protein